MLAKLGIGVAVFITYMVMFYVPLDFLEPYVYKIIKLDTFTYKYPRYFNVIQTLVQIVFRTFLVLITGQYIHILFINIYLNVCFNSYSGIGNS